MARPPERTWAFGSVPYDESPFICSDCGKIVAWESEPQLVGRFSEEPEVKAKIEEYRGIPLPDEEAMRPARRRKGGFLHKHFSFQLPSGEWREQGIGGSWCPECIQATKDEHAAFVANRDKLATLLKREPSEPAAIKPEEGA